MIGGYLVLVVLAGLAVLDVVIAHTRRIADEREHRRYERDSHAQLMRELHRHGEP